MRVSAVSARGIDVKRRSLRPMGMPPWSLGKAISVNAGSPSRGRRPDEGVGINASTASFLAPLCQ